MSRRIRALVAALLASVVLFGYAAPAAAALENTETERSVPVLFDALFLRPLGLAVTVAGAVFFIVPGSIVALTRPTDIGKPFNALVVEPARFTFVDPLGTH